MEKLKSCIILMIIFLISALSVLPINAQQEQPELDPEVKKLIEQTPMKKNYKESGAVILLKEGRDVVNADGTTKYTGHIVGKILDKKAKTDHNQIVIGFNSYYEDISLDYARTIRADGTIQEVSKDAIQIKTSGESSRRYTDMRRLTFSLPSLKVGSVFEYQYTERQKRPIIPDEWVAGFRFHYLHRNPGSLPPVRVDPVHQSRYNLQVPEGEKFQHQLRNIDISPAVKKEAGYVQYTWETNELPAIPYEERMPNIHDLTFGIHVTSLKNWDEIDAWANERILSRVETTPEIKAKAEELTASYATAEEKMEALYYFIQTEFEYVQADLDRGGYTPHYASEIYENLYGDCKDQVTLFISLLKSAGIRAYPALINPYPYWTIDRKFPTPHFSHLIVYIPTDQKEYWLDTTSDVTPFPNLYYSNQGRWAFVIDGKGGKFHKTPLAKAEENLVISEINSLIEGTNYKNEMILKTRGYFNDTNKPLVKMITPNKREQHYRESIKSLLNNTDIDSLTVSNPDNPQENFRLFIQLNRPDVWEPSDFFFAYEGNAAFPFWIFTGFQSLPSPEERTHDFIFGFKFKTLNTENYLPPTSEYKVVNLPANDSLITPYVSFHRGFYEQNDTVKANWELTLKQLVIPQEDYGNFYDSVQNIIDLLSWQVTFSRKSGPMSSREPNQQDSQKNELRLSVIVSETREEAQRIITKLEGGADFAALAKKHSVGPGKENGGDIGYISPDQLMNELKTVADTLAVKQYSKIIETANGYFIIKKTAEKIAGDAEESHSFSTYLEKGKTAYKNKNFAKAIDYLEKAVKLEPENQEAHYFLGYAYELYSDPDGSLLTELQRKPIEKASKHFQKLIEISPKYEGELLDFHPYDKLTSVWGYLAMAYAYHGKTDSARWAFKQGRAAGGFYPAILEFNKNILASCEENAILFTFGEKVIFPIWFLRFMEGYRRDVNVVDLSLLNHAWYVKMLKNDDPYTNNTIPLKLTEDEIGALKFQYWPEQRYEIPVQNDPMNLSGKVRWVVEPTYEDRYLRIQDQVLIKIIESNQWERPIYFSSTVTENNMIGLEEYLTLEGLVYRLISHKTEDISANKLIENCLNRYTFNTIEDVHSKYNPGLVDFFHNYRWCFYELALYYYHQDENDKILEILETMDAKIPPDIIPYTNKYFESMVFNLLGLAYDAKESYEQAIDIYNMAISTEADNKYVYANKGNTLRKMEHYDEALDALDKAIHIDADFVRAHQIRGSIFLSMNDYNQALDTYNKIITIDPDNEYAHANKGNTLRKMDRYDEALAALDQAIHLDPDYKWAYRMRGLAFINMNKFEQAIRNFNKAISVDPQYTYAYIDKGVALRYLMRFDEAVDACKKAIEIDPENDWGYHQLGHTYELMKQYKDAIASFKKAIERDPKVASVYTDIGKCYAHMENFDQAFSYAEKGMEIDSSEHNNFENIGWIYYLKGDFPKAIEYSEKAIASDSTCEYAKYTFALYHLRSGEIERAKQLYQETRDYDLSLNRKHHPSVIEDLKDLIKQDTMAKEARRILSDVFDIKDPELKSN